ncbi:hypothetical protein AGMMS50268_40400 [Spirochaetia bacterium]|nr:hypothetical protein AGMMS50268_40400 [Spirochaetia bacterium]
MTYVLDSSAVIAFINRESGGDIVKRLIAEAGQGDCSLSISIVQLLEIFYDHVYHNELEAVEKGENLSVLWLPARPKK